MENQQITLDPQQFTHRHDPIRYAVNEYEADRLITTIYTTNMPHNQTRIVAYSIRSVVADSELLQLNRIERYNDQDRLIQVDYVDGTVISKKFRVGQ